MNQLKIGNIVTLDENRKYAVTATATKKNYNYVYLVTIDEPYKILFAKEILNGKDIDLEVVSDKKDKEELLKLFKQELKKLKI